MSGRRRSQRELSQMGMGQDEGLSIDSIWKLYGRLGVVRIEHTQTEQTLPGFLRVCQHAYGGIGT
jgi:hypothetical protein